MIDTYSVALSKLVQEFDLTILHESTDYPSIRLTVEDVARPGLQLTGFFDHYEPLRLQVMGNVEMSYMAKQSEAERNRVYDRLFSYRFPAMLIARGIQPDEQLMAMAIKHNITLLSTDQRTSAITSGIITYLKDTLAPRVTRHGVLVEAYGEGVLITGESGIGKSEAALELVKRGHRLIADDAVEIQKVIESLLFISILSDSIPCPFEQIGVSLDGYSSKFNPSPVIEFFVCAAACGTS